MPAITIVYDKKRIDIQQWQHFVDNHPKGSVFQTPQMFACYKQTPRWKPLVLAAYMDNELAGILVATIIREKGKLKGRFSTRAIIPSGPVVSNDDPKILDALLKAYNGMMTKEVIYTQIRNQYDQLACCDIFRDNGFVFEPHLNFLVKLDGDENMWARIGKGRKKQIKKAIKNGLTVNAYQSGEISDKLLEQGFDIIRQVYQRSNLPLVDIEQIKATAREGLLVMFTVCSPHGDVIGCRFGLRHGNVLYGWYAGSMSKYYTLFPNDILIWETMRWASANHFDVFDYGGAGSPNKPYGVRTFKQQMGGDLVDYGRYEKVHRPWMMRIATTGYTIYRKLFKF